MSAQPNAQGMPITNKAQLIDYLAEGEKPQSAWRIGAEHEKFVFRRSDLRPVSYDGPNGIRALLEGMRRFGWEPVYEGDRLLALGKGMCSITLEPGGQFELSGAPRETVHEIAAETQTHLNHAGEVARELGVGMLGLGFEPKWTRAEIQPMPKNRSAIMRRYMPKRGSLGLDMMHRTCTVQVNLDFSSEADMIAKFRVGLALQPIATALFANSPFSEGKLNGYLSYRSQIWTDTDNDRSGILPFVFDDGFGYERYVDYMLDVPMYFVFRDGGYIDAAGQSFRAFLKGELPALPGEVPHIGDWSDHLTTAFPEVRLKRFLEMRGADCGSWPHLCALPALWVGLIYDRDALAAAGDLISGWRFDEVLAMRNEVPAQGLRTQFRGKAIRTLACEMLDIAKGGLQRRARPSADFPDESHFLDPLFTIAQSGQTAADVMLEKYYGPWDGNIDRLFAEYAY